MDGGKKRTKSEGRRRERGGGRKKATRREKKIGILPERRMIKLRMVRCYRNPDWDESSDRAHLPTVAIYMYVHVIYLGPCSIHSLYLFFSFVLNTRLGFNFRKTIVVFYCKSIKFYIISKSYIHVKLTSSRALKCWALILSHFSLKTNKNKVKKCVKYKRYD